MTCDRACRRSSCPYPSITPYPYSDFGWLSAEVWRAARLVVDTGLHKKRWSRQHAIDYLIENTPEAKDECVRAINRYLVMPGQATSYKIGMLKILELRKHAIAELRDSFDIRQFHDVILVLALTETTIEPESPTELPNRPSPCRPCHRCPYWDKSLFIAG